MGAQESSKSSYENGERTPVGSVRSHRPRRHDGGRISDEHDLRSYERDVATGGGKLNGESRSQSGHLNGKPFVATSEGSSSFLGEMNGTCILRARIPSKRVLFARQGYGISPPREPS